jgi:hypothetical protein
VSWAKSRTHFASAPTVWVQCRLRADVANRRAPLGEDRPSRHGGAAKGEKEIARTIRPAPLN